MPLSVLFAFVDRKMTIFQVVLERHAQNYGTKLFLLIIIISFVFSLIPKHINPQMHREISCKVSQTHKIQAAAQLAATFKPLPASSELH